MKVKELIKVLSSFPDQEVEVVIRDESESFRAPYTILDIRPNRMALNVCFKIKAMDCIMLTFDRDETVSHLAKSVEEIPEKDVNGEFYLSFKKGDTK